MIYIVRRIDVLGIAHGAEIVDLRGIWPTLQRAYMGRRPSGAGRIAHKLPYDAPRLVDAYRCRGRGRSCACRCRRRGLCRRRRVFVVRAAGGLRLLCCCMRARNGFRESEWWRKYRRRRRRHRCW